jgi:hypothetical protein
MTHNDWENMKGYLVLIESKLRGKEKDLVRNLFCHFKAAKRKVK